MKTLNLIRSITKLASRAFGIIYGLYVSLILIIRAAAQIAPTTEDIVSFTLLGLIVCIIFMLDYIINTCRLAVKRQYRKSTF